MQLLYPKSQVDLQMMAAGPMMMPQHQLRPVDFNAHIYNMKGFSQELSYVPPMLSHRLAIPFLRRPRRRRSNHSLVATMDPTAVARRNERERNRVKQVNDGFDELRKRVPFLPDRKKLSKVEILRYAMLYMVDLQCVIEDFDRNNPHREKLNQSAKTEKRAPLSEHSVSDNHEMYVISDDGDADSDDLSETSECSSKST